LTQRSRPRCRKRGTQFRKRTLISVGYVASLNLAGLAVVNRELIAKAKTIDSPQRVVLNMDSTVFVN